MNLVQYEIDTQIEGPECDSWKTKCSISFLQLADPCHPHLLFQLHHKVLSVEQIDYTGWAVRKNIVC